MYRFENEYLDLHAKHDFRVLDYDWREEPYLMLPLSILPTTYDRLVNASQSAREKFTNNALEVISNHLETRVLVSEEVGGLPDRFKTPFLSIVTPDSMEVQSTITEIPLVCEDGPVGSMTYIPPHKKNKRVKDGLNAHNNRHLHLGAVGITLDHGLFLNVPDRNDLAEKLRTKCKFSPC